MNLRQQNRARSHLDRAELAMGAGHLDLANQHLHSCLDLTPDLPEARIVQARLELLTNHPDQALSVLDARDLDHPHRRDEPAAAFCRVQCLCRAGEEDLAAPLLKRLAEEYHDDPRPQRMLAAIFIKQNKTQEAISHLQRVVKLSPSDRTARHVLVELVARHHPDRAAALILEDPQAMRDPLVQLRAAQLYRQAERLREAEEWYRRLLDFRGDDASLWYEAGKLADDLGNYELAQQRLARAIALSPGRQRKALCRLALAHLHAGQMDSARDCWRRLRHLVPQSAQPWAGTLVCALAAGQKRLAQRAGAGLRERASAQERRNMLAQLWPHVAVGDTLARIDIGQYQNDADPDEPLQAVIESARARLADHLKRYPDRADTHYHLAVCLDQLGRRSESGRSLANALHLNPRYADAKRLARSQRLEQKQTKCSV